MLAVEPGPPSVERQGVAGLSTLVALTAASLMGAGLVAVAVNYKLDKTLHVATDIIGYPTFHAFNPYVYEQQYYLAVVVFPLLTAVMLAASVWLARRFGLTLPHLRRPRADPSELTVAERTNPVPEGIAVASRVARILTVGAVLGISLAVMGGDAPAAVVGHVAITTALYLVVICLLTAVAAVSPMPLRRLRADVWMSRWNAVGAVLAAGGVVAASQVTQVQVASDGSVRHYRWLPLWVGVLVVATSLVLLVVVLHRNRGSVQRTAVIERRALFLVAVPVGIFLAIASLVPPLAVFSAFERGQSLATLRLVQEGGFPWRDWMTVHGVFEDAIQTLVSRWAIEDTAWGIDAGFTLLFVPLMVLGLYLLAYRVMGRAWPLLVVLVVLVYQPEYPLIYIRYMTWPLVLVLLGRVIETRSRLLAGSFGVLLAAQAVISPETAYCVPAAGLALVGSDAVRVGWRAAARLRGFSVTVYAFCGGLLTTAVLIAVLLSQHALPDFVRFYTALAPGHALTGGIPRFHLRGSYAVKVLLPIAAIFLTMGLLGVKAWLRLRLTWLDWMLAAAAIVTFLYYPKFLDRADLHVDEVFAASVPFFIILVAALLRAGASAFRRLRFMRPVLRPLRYGLSALVLVAVTLASPVSPRAVLQSAPARFRVVAETPPLVTTLGYAAPTAVDRGLLNDLNVFFGAFLKPGDKIFDFTNEPGILFYLLHYRPATAYYEISVAMRQVIQQDVVAQLRADRPLFVVFAQKEAGLPEWDDVPNMVRHYDVAQYILAHFRPYADVHGQVIYVANDARVPPASGLKLNLSTPLITSDLGFRAPSCDWGHSPDYLSITPAPSSRPRVTVSATPISPTTYALTLPAGRRWSDYSWIEIRPKDRFVANAVRIEDASGPPGEARAVTFATSPSSPSAYRFPIGACSQWPMYGDSQLQMTLSAPQALGSITLVP